MKTSVFVAALRLSVGSKMKRALRAAPLATVAATLCYGSLAHSAPIPVFGGPTYSDTTGGYLVTGARLGGHSLTGAFSFIPLSGNFGAVNDAGIAVGNFDRLATPLTANPQNAPLVAVRWGAVVIPAEIALAGADAMAQVRAINSAGTVTGVHATGVVHTRSTGGVSLSTTNSVGNPARWPSPATTVQTLPDLAGTAAARGSAYAINNLGTILGSFTKFKPSGELNGSRVARWEPGATTATELGVLDTNPDALSGALGISINSSGAAVGYVTDATVVLQPVRWDAGQTAATKLDNLGTPVGASTDGAAMSINDSGVAVGYARKFSPTGSNLGLRAVRWNAGGTAATELGNLGTDSNVVAVAINNAGTVIGLTERQKTTFPFNFIPHAIRWNADSTTPFELTAIATDGQSIPFAINSQGIVVGSADAPRPASSILDQHAVLWGTDGVPVDLNSLIDPSSGWTLTQATDISDTGWILGAGQFDPDGAGSRAAYSRMFLMQVPEPSTLALLALGAVGICLHRARRRVNETHPPL
jgi:uncharacterized membrane protein